MAPKLHNKRGGSVWCPCVYRISTLSSDVPGCIILAEEAVYYTIRLSKVNLASGSAFGEFGAALQIKVDDAGRATSTDN